jgi:hypothetical protein
MTTFTASALAATASDNGASARGHAEAAQSSRFAGRARGAGEADLSPQDWNRTEPATPGAAAGKEMV